MVVLFHFKNDLRIAIFQFGLHIVGNAFGFKKKLIQSLLRCNR